MSWASFAKGLIGGWQSGEQFSAEMAKNRREAAKAPYLDYLEMVKAQDAAKTIPMQGQYDRADLRYKMQERPYESYEKVNKSYYSGMSEKPRWEVEKANAELKGMDVEMSRHLQPHLKNAAMLASINNIMGQGSQNFDPANPKPAFDWMRSRLQEVGAGDFLGAYANLPPDQMANFMTKANIWSNNFINQQRTRSYTDSVYPVTQQPSYSYSGHVGPNGQVVDPTAMQVPAGFTTMLPAAAAPTAPPAVPSLAPAAAAAAPAAPAAARAYTPGTATTSPRVYIPATQPAPAGALPYTPQQGMGTTAIVPNNTGLTRYYAGHPNEYRGR